MDLYSLNINIDEEVKSYKIEDKFNDYIAVQKQVIPILENEKFYGAEKIMQQVQRQILGKRNQRDTGKWL